MWEKDVLPQYPWIRRSTRRWKSSICGTSSAAGSSPPSPNSPPRACGPVACPPRWPRRRACGSPGLPAGPATDGQGEVRLHLHGMRRQRTPLGRAVPPVLRLEYLGGDRGGSRSACERLGIIPIAPEEIEGLIERGGGMIFKRRCWHDHLPALPTSGYARRSSGR